MTSELESLLRFSLPSTAGPREVALQMPLMEELNGLITGPESHHEAHLARVLPLVLLVFVDRLDGDAVTLARADAIAADAELARALLIRIRTMLDTLRERGVVFALCPHCGLWEAEVGMNAFALTVAAPLPSTFDGPFIATPSLATNLVAEFRPPLPRAARIRFELPSLRLGIEGLIRAGVLGEVQYVEGEFEGRGPAYGDFDDDDEDAPIRHGAGWRALSRLARALEPPVVDDDIESLPAIDFFFLDLVHWLVAMAPVRPDTAGKIRCPRCSGEFLPVRRDFRA